MRLIIISGRSGSGKSVCLNILEDLGYYCINNLPLGLLPQLPHQIGKNHHRVAVSIDARNLDDNSENYEKIIAKLDQASIKHETIFLDADDNKLLERFSMTRRKHPLSTNAISLAEALANESILLAPIAAHADLRIDTSDMTIYDFRDILVSRISDKNEQFSILFESFGFKNGVPHDCDYVFDVRCLPNPHWEENLRTLTGFDTDVIAFLEKYIEVKDMLHDIQYFLDKWIPLFKQSNRSYMTIGIGCTGGQHRSVYIAECLATHFNKSDDIVQIRHRELV